MPLRSRLLARLRRRDDRGGIAMVFVLMMSGGVVLGTSAIVTDVGNIYAERAELQTGADGAAMAVAEDCVKTPISCASAAATTAGGFGNRNASDGAATVEVCGRNATAPLLQTCGAAKTNRTACVRAAPTTGNFVEVHARTRTAGGSTLLPPTLARGLIGNESYNGTSVATCARASWGPPETSTGVAFTVSTCEWNIATSNGTNFQVNPSVGYPPADARQIIWMKGNDAPTCAGQSGWDAPGGFGWLDEVGGPCRAIVTADGSTDGDTGSSVSQTCRDALDSAVAARSVQYVPVYDGVTGNGSNTVYHMVGVSAFVITGYDLAGLHLASWLGTSPCSGNDRCIYGYFTSTLSSAVGPIGNGANLGVSVLALTG